MVLSFFCSSKNTQSASKKLLQLIFAGVLLLCSQTATGR